MLKSYHNILAEKMTDPTSFPVEDEMVFNIGDVTRNFGDDRRIIFKNHEENGRSTLKIHKNINYALVGENGSGKTTLFKILTKLSPYNGLITYWDGNPYELRDMPRYLCVNKNQLVFQKTGNAIIEDTPIQEYLLSFFNEREKQLHGIEPKITGLIEAFFPSEQKRQLIPNSLFRELSVGEQRRILLIRSLLLVDRDGILFIDEAMRGMDVFLKERLVHYLKKEQLQIFLISHDKDLVDALCHRKIRLDSKNGKTMIIPDIKNIVKNEINSPAGAFGGNE
jgi:ABC-type multidrug transport system ATPase subunit